jgi:hypothetical protein
VPFLGSLPLEPALRIAADEGEPLVISNPDNLSALAFKGFATSLSPLIR